MASRIKASTQDASPVGFGRWLRELREGKGKLLRGVAAAADMDPSHLGKAERGERLPSLEKVPALAKTLGVPEGEVRSRFFAARLWSECGGDAALAVEAAGRVREHASAYLVNNAPNKK